MIAAISFAVTVRCATPAAVPTTDPDPTPDIDATIRVSVEQTATSSTSIENTIAAAVEATQKAVEEQQPTATPPAIKTATVVIPTLAPPTVIAVVVPTVIPTQPPTPTTVPPAPTPLPTQPPVPAPTAIATVTPVPTATTPIVLSLSELIDQVRGSIVQVITNRGLGSGVIIEVDSSGAALILTNQHVIDQTSSIEVVYSEQTTYPASLIGVDALRDLAVLRICCDFAFTPLSFSNSDDVKLGESVVALGFPLGVDSLRVSQGIVAGIQFNSADDRSELQTDASINPGNSGGPLLLLDGTIAGINTYVIRASSDGVSVEGFGFAVASETLELIVPSLSAGQVVTVPTPTPHPSLVTGKYVDDDYGFDITPPPGWLIDSRPDGVVTWDEYAGATIIVSVEFQRAEYQNTQQFIDDFTLAPSDGWTDFVIDNEQSIFRTSADGAVLVMGHEFNTTFNSDGVNYESFTHWFIRSGWLYQIDLATPSDVWQLPEYAELRLEQQLAFVSFHPPSS